ncbi:SPL family radical SAM protein [Magnetospirillum molischianum]|uniref:Radical SAM domain protein n=1 Tax=Magnetospirillum molischianum DSM 120 TaxID=1150626 RepID=H8FSQ3_MAGML|nr:DUF5131 family protein [Magnetospirillum molischianum]CCG41391.1 Radical SAM domain protein [Magnetospirillum molischianum DSM 120]
MNIKIVETTAKSIISASKIPDADYVVNPYTGCSFACSYCYASFMGRFVGEPIETWGSYLYVKTNAVELFERELARFSTARRKSSIFLSSVTDAWQGPEKKYRLARGILQVLSKTRYPGPVSILTKSPLVQDDLATIASLPAPDVGVTITSTDDAISRAFEVHAPSASSRIEVLRTFNNAEIPTYAFIGPLFPHFRFLPNKLEELFSRIAETGTKRIYVEQINLSAYIRKRLDTAMRESAPDLVAAYTSADEAEHRRALEEMVQSMAPRHGLTIRRSTVIDHRRDAKAIKDLFQ